MVINPTITTHAPTLTLLVWVGDIDNLEGWDIACNIPSPINALFTTPCILIAFLRN